jgi:hypothetical protein
MTSKFKALTDNTPPLSSDESTEARAQPFKPSVGTDNTQAYTPTSQKQYKSISPTGKNVSERSRQHIAIMMVVLSRLEEKGFIRRFKVLSADGKWKETQIVFDNTIWTENLDLKVLS